MTEYLNGESIRLKATYTDSSGVAYDPDTVELKIYDPVGVLKSTVTYAAGDIEKNDTGVYFYDYTIPADGAQGYWIQTFTGVITGAGTTDISEGQFYCRSPTEKLYVSVVEVKAKLGSDKMTMDDMDIRMCIRNAMAETDQVVGRTFTNANDKTEWFSTNQSNPNYTVNQLFLTYLPVQSITSLKEYDTSKAVVKTYTASEYWIDSNGIIELCEDEFEHQRNRVEVVYTYGYSAVPMKISKLCSVISQINVLLEYMIQQDTAITAYSVGDINTSIGESYVTTERAMARLEKEKATIIKEIGSLRTDIFIC